MTEGEVREWCATKDVVFNCRKINVFTPWSDGDFTIATNGVILIRVPRISSVVEREIPIDHRAMMPNVEPSEWFSIPEIPQMMTCITCKGSGSVKCPECLGSGGVEFSTEYNDYEVACESCNEDGAITCRHCGGLARVYPTAAIAIGSAWFEPRVLARLAKLPNVLIAPTSPNTPDVFRFDGGDGFVMSFNPSIRIS